MTASRYEPGATAPAADPACRPEVARGIADGLPVLAGIVPFAMVLGAEAARKGFGLLDVPLMTGMNFAGGSEFAAVRLWTTPPRALLIAAVTLLVNSRHLVMGGVLTPYLRRLPWRHRLPALFLMCDASWALGLADAQRRGALSLPYYFGVAVPILLVWVAFTTLGAVLGPALGDGTRLGFDMAFPAVFLVLLRGLWRGMARSRPWLVSLVTAAITSRILPGEAYIALGILSGLLSSLLFIGGP